MSVPHGTPSNARGSFARVLFPGALLLALGSASCGGDGADADTPRMNVLLVTLDTTRPDHMSCYGGAPGTTPTIDALAKAGARFERAVSTAGITPMSHASILTGLNNYAHGMRVFYSPIVSHKLKEAVDTLPEILGGVGYRTAARVSSYPVSKHYGLDQGFGDFDSGVDLGELDLEQQQRHETVWDTGGESNTQRRGDITTTSALEWLDANGESGPWCMWLHMFDVHDYSIVPPAEFAATHGIEYPDPEKKLTRDEQVDWRERMYDAELNFMDAQIARMVDWLETHGQLDNTVIVITADHGQGLKDGLERHGWMKHRLLYDWSVRVPLIVRIPGVTGGEVIDAQVRTIDVLPTIIDAVGAPVRNPVEGDTLLPLIRGEEETEPRVAYADALNDYDAHSPPAKRLPEGQKDNLYMACDGRWKFIWHERNPEASELYDLLKDPDELENVYRTDHPMVPALKGFLDDRGAAQVEAPGSGSNAPDVAALRSLGYTGGEDDEEDVDEAVEDGSTEDRDR